MADKYAELRKAGFKVTVRSPNAITGRMNVSGRTVDSRVEFISDGETGTVSLLQRGDGHNWRVVRTSGQMGVNQAIGAALALLVGLERE